MKERLSIDVIGQNGGTLGTLEFADENGRPSIGITDDTQPQVQLLEEHSYEIAFRAISTAVNARPKFSAPFLPSRLTYEKFVGRLPSSRFVGTVTLSIVDELDQIAATVAVEVRSRKLEYLTEFYAMVDDLSGIAIDLVTSLKSLFNTTLTIDRNSKPQTVQQHLLFLKSICESQEIFVAFNRIQAFPHMNLRTHVLRQSVTKAVPNSRQLGRSLRAFGERLHIPGNHPLYGRIKSVPKFIFGIERFESLDTVENRFAKFVLLNFADFASHAIDILGNYSNTDRSLFEWLLKAHAAFREIASAEFFKEVGNLQVIPMGSPALQQLHGYRQILDAWLKFNSASRVSWSALDDTFSAGQRDAALLYEYWCFFALRAALLAAFEIEDEDLGGVLRQTHDRLSITLKSGDQAAVKGVFQFKNRKFGMRLSYEQSFVPINVVEMHGYCRSDSHFGSWSKRMDPDFTVSIWEYSEGASDGGEASASSSRRFANVHFDAKYRVTFDQSAVDKSQKLRAKGDDVDKMHAYLDAIRNSYGAYVLYPGDTAEFYCRSESVVPGVGFIGLRPGDSGGGKEQLRGYLLQLMECLHDTCFSEG